MRKTYVLRDGQLVEKHLAMPLQENAGPFVMGDIQPYKSQLTGEMVTSRSRHRNLLREHGCIEVGNETRYLKPKPITTPPGRKEAIIRAAAKYRGS
jgi:hypothetical protein